MSNLRADERGRADPQRRRTAGALCALSVVAAMLCTLLEHANAQQLEPSSFQGPQRAGEGISITFPPELPILFPPLVATTSFDKLEPICRFRRDMLVQGRPAIGSCNLPQLDFSVPEFLHYGDLSVDIAAQCLWLDDCRGARAPGGPGSERECDRGFRQMLEAECRKVLSGCVNILEHCLKTVAKVSQAVAGFDHVSVAAESPAPGMQEAPDIGVTPSRIEPGPRWVYVGEFEKTWIKRNFAIKEMVSPGDTMAATEYVNVRLDRVRLNPDTGEWENAEKTGLISPGETVTVIQVENLGREGASAHIWARIR